MSDMANSIESNDLELLQVISPTLTLPYLALAAQYKQSVTQHSNCLTRITCDHYDAMLITTPSKGWLSEFNSYITPKSNRCTDIRITFESLENSPRPQKSHYRTTISTESLAELMQFAEMTYAPATETSRLGAGAGENDND